MTNLKRFWIHCFILYSIFFNPNHMVWSQQIDAGRSDLHQADFENKLIIQVEHLLNKHKIPGAGLAIVSRDSVRFLGGVGLADVKTNQVVDENTLFRAGSISKTFVALGIMMLVETNQLDLQSAVRDILPELEIDNPWAETDPVRVVHLLEHTAGLNDPTFNDYYLDENPHIPLKVGIEVSEHYLDVRWKPGSYRSYSSAGFMLAGMIIEKISEKRFEDYLKDTIMLPIGMTTSTFRLNEQSQELLAQGYKAGYQPSQYWYTYSRPAGSLITSAAEMARFVQFMLSKGQINGKQILSDDSMIRLERSTTDPAVKAGLESRAGLGVGIGYYKGFKWYMHHGSIMGFAGAYGYCRELDIGCVLLTNRWDVDFRSGMIALWDTLRSFTVKYNAKPPSVIPMIRISKDTLQTYTGYYQWCNPPQQLSAWIDLILNYQVIWLKNDTLFHKEIFFGSAQPLIPVSSATFRDMDEHQPTKVFTTSADGDLVFIDGGAYYRETFGIKAWLHGLLFFLSWIAMFSSIFYAVIWIPYYIYRKITHKTTLPYLRIRILPLAAVLLILISFSLVGMQVEESVAYLGQKTTVNVLFYLSTWLFAIFSVVSLFCTVKSLKEPVGKFLQIYALVLSITLVGMTLYWAYWGMIGIRLWAY